METKQKSHQKEHLYKLLESFDEKELKKVKKFAELLNKAKKTNDMDLMRILEDAQYTKDELNSRTLKDIKKSRSEFKKGKVYTLSQVKKELGI